MPTHVEKRPVKSGKDYAIIEDSTGHIKGRAKTRKDAGISSWKRSGGGKK